MKKQSSYIFLEHPYKKEEKKTNEDSNVIVLDIGTSVYSFIEKSFSTVKSIKDDTNLFISKFQGTINDCDVTFLIHEVARNVYLDIVVEGKNQKAVIECLESVQNNLLNSGIRDYYVDIISYDAISEYYCNKIVSKLNSFERNIRKLMYNIYTLNFGKDYYQATMSSELQEKIKGVISTSLTKEEKSQIKTDYHVNGNQAEAILRLQQFFSSFELADMQSFLFEPTWTSYDKESREEFLNKNPDLSELTNEELREAFEQLTPKSDWDRFFSSKIAVANIDQLIDSIRRYRNSVAHFKRFSREDYNNCNKIIKELNKSVIEAIKITEEKDFVDKNIEIISDIFSGAVERIRKIVEPIKKVVENGYFKKIQLLAESLQRTVTSFSSGFQPNIASDEYKDEQKNSVTDEPTIEDLK